MSEEQNEIQADRQARIDKNKDKNNLIADDGLKDHVYDIYDILATSREPEVLKLRNLMQAGVTEEYIVDVYTGISGNVVSMAEALSALDATFLCIATAVTNYPNGIVIDLTTGLVDEEKSAEQATEVGILEESQYEEYVNMKMQEFQEKKSAKEIVEKSEELIAMGSIMRDLDIKRNSDWYRKYKSASDFMGNASKECVAYVDECMNILKQFSKEEAEYIRLVHDMKHAEGTVMYDELVAKEIQMLQEHPELAEMKLKDEKGNLNPIIDEFMNAEKNAMIGKMLTNFNNININELDDKNDDEKKLKKFITIFSIAAMKTSVYKEEALKVLGLSDKTLTEQLTFFNSVLGTKMKTEEALQKKIDLFSEAIEHAADITNIFEVIQSDKIQDFVIDDLIDAMGQDLTVTGIEKQLKENKKTIVEKQFDGSKINFYKDDLDKINESYKEGTINSWISSKQEAKEYKVLMLALQKEELGNIKSKAQIHESHRKMIDNRVKKEIEKNPELAELFDENGEIKPEAREKAELFQNEKLKSEIMKLYVKDLNDDKDYSRENFDKMNNSAKKEYIRTTIVGLDFAEKNGNIALKKLALRRLEVLNEGQNEENKIIEVDKNCNYTLHSERLLDLYAEQKDLPGVSNFEDLRTKMAAQMISLKIVKKMDEILDIPDNEFLDFSDLPPEEKLKAIENSKTEGRRKRVESGKEKPYNDPRKEEVEQDKSEEIKDEQESAVVQENEELSNKELSNEESNNVKSGLFNSIKNFFNTLKNRNQLRITDGNEVPEKKGFFSRLFNKKENEDVSVVRIDMNEETKKQPVKNKSSFEESLRYGERDGSLEKNAIDGMKRQDNSGKSQDRQEQEYNG